MLQFIEIAARIIGGFYAVGAIFLIRHMAMTEMLDRAIAAIEMQQEPQKQVIRRWLLGIGAVLTGASGVATLLLSSWALPLFALNLLVQGGWLVWATRAFPPQDAEEVLGRRRTFNAAFFYATVAATVMALAYEGRLAPWGEWQTAVPAAVATAGYFAYLVRCLRLAAMEKQETPQAGDAEGDPLDDEYRQPRRVRFEVHPWRYPMIDADDGRLLNHYRMLDSETANEIEAWHNDYIGFVAGAGEGATSVFPSEEVEAEHKATADNFVGYLRDIYGHENVEGPIYLPRETWEMADADIDPDGGDAGNGRPGRGP